MAKFADVSTCVFHRFMRRWLWCVFVGVGSVGVEIGLCVGVVYVSLVGWLGWLGCLLVWRLVGWFVCWFVVWFVWRLVLYVDIMGEEG